jgi:hypothetical protein
VLAVASLGLWPACGPGQANVRFGLNPFACQPKAAAHVVLLETHFPGRPPWSIRTLLEIDAHQMSDHGPGRKGAVVSAASSR